MDLSQVLIGLIAIVVLVNVTSTALWFWLQSLVRSADPILSFRTASMYTTILFKQIMESRFYRAPSAMTLGNPNRDPIIRAVRGMDQFATIETVASYIKELPINFVPRMI